MQNSDEPHLALRYGRVCAILVAARRTGQRGEADGSNPMAAGRMGSWMLHCTGSRSDLAGILLMAYSARAAMVSDGLMPGLAGMIEPSTTYKPG